MRLNVKNIFGAGLIALAFSVGTAKIASAQSCTVPPTCDALGYTKTATDCKDMSTLKCPFDQSKVFCVTAAEAGGAGSCKVANVGDILFSDMSCGSSMVDGKRAIGVIFEPDYRLAVALSTTTKVWSTEYFDIPGLTNSSQSEAMADYNGKNNTKTIMTYCVANSKSCPAAEYASNFSTLGTQAGDWYLPGLGELNALYSHKTAVNEGLSKAKGTALPDSYHWSSSEHSNNLAWGQGFGNGNVNYYNKADSSNYVRPVLAF